MQLLALLCDDTDLVQCTDALYQIKEEFPHIANVLNNIYHKCMMHFNGFLYLL